MDRIYDTATAAQMGLAEGTVCVMIHTGSRGLGHQICTDHVRQMEKAMSRYGIQVPDRQLACVPVRSPEGQAYLAAMAAAANYGHANRQLLTEATRKVFEAHTTTTLEVMYDVSHNLAKIEIHPSTENHAPCVYIARARAAPCRPSPDLPADLADVGQPVLIPGTMGTASYVLAGVPDNPAFFSTAHGAGRVQSRHPAARGTNADVLRKRLEERGILVAAAPGGGSPRKNPRLTRTSTKSSRPATTPGSHESRPPHPARGREGLSTRGDGPQHRKRSSPSRTQTAGKSKLVADARCLLFQLPWEEPFGDRDDQGDRVRNTAGGAARQCGVRGRRRRRDRSDLRLD